MIFKSFSKQSNLNNTALDYMTTLIIQQKIRRPNFNSSKLSLQYNYDIHNANHLWPKYHIIVGINVHCSAWMS